MIPKTSVDRILARIGRLYSRAAKSLVSSAVAAEAKATEEKQFNFRDYPGLEKEANRIIREVSANTTKLILSGEQRSWLMASTVNSDLVQSLFKGKIPEEAYSRFLGRNLEALRAFQNRTVGGLNLSTRIWNYTKTFEADAKIVLDNGLLTGKSASKIADELARHVVKPDVAFDEFRDNRGAIHLSKEAKHYHPGSGHYRSSLKNAERVARTEINNAYRASDKASWDGMNFVVGYEVVRSNNPYPCPRCEALVGKYPKTFIFTGWHPQCRCTKIPILATDDEFETLMEIIDDEEAMAAFQSTNSVKDLPKNFREYVKEHQAKVKDAWWYRDNEPLFETAKADPFKALRDGGFTVSGNPDTFQATVSGLDFNKLNSDISALVEKKGAKVFYRNIDVDDDGLVKFQFRARFGDRDEDVLQLNRSFFVKGGVRQVNHELFDVPKKYQGGGLSREVFKALYEQYNAAGITRINVHANIDVGGYAWAKYGFTVTFKSQNKFMLNRARRALPAKEFPKFNEFYEKALNMPNPINTVANSKWGKDVLIGSDWDGHLDLSNALFRKVFEDYLFSR